MASTKVTARTIVATASHFLRRTGRAPDVGTLVGYLGIRRRAFYLAFRSRAELHVVLVHAHDELVRQRLGQVVDADTPVRERLRAFLHRLMHGRLACVPIERPPGMESGLRDEIGRLLRGLLREGVARGELSAPDVGRAGRAVLEATDRFLEALPLQLADAQDDVGDLADEEIQVFEALFEDHWLAVSRLLSIEGGATAQ
jgi:AcrR family transcriptional regulator